MQKRMIKLGAILTLMVLCSLPVQLRAFGIGIYVPVGSGSGTLEFIDYSDSNTDYDWSYGGGFGIVLDTRVAKRGLFNYRLNLGMANGTQNYGGADVDGFKYYMFDNTFGFAVVQTRVVRVFLAPQIGLSYLTYTDPDNLGESWDAFGFSFAPVVGANFNFGKMFTVGLDLGYKFGSYAGTFEYTTTDIYGYDNTVSEDFTQSKKGFFLNLSLILRIGDVFDSGQTDVDEDKPNYDEEYY